MLCLQDVTGLDSGCDSLDTVQILYTPAAKRRRRSGGDTGTLDVQFDQYQATLEDLQPVFHDVQVVVSNTEGLSSSSDTAEYDSEDSRLI